MKNNVQYESIKERRKKIYTKDIFVDLLLLIPPILVETGIVLVSLTTYSVSLFLTYFVLPMFYTVERRISSRISGIGNPKFSYIDGYKAFFQQRAGGIFGIILSIIGMLALALLFYFLLSPSFPSLCNAFDGARDVYDHIYEVTSSSGTIDYKDFVEYVSANIHYLTKPMTIMVGCIMFVPSFYFFFYCISTNLCDHYLASIVLPDIDLNISASESRGLSRGSFKRFLFKKRLSYALKQNWVFYLIYVLLYAATLYLFSNISAFNGPTMSLIILATPSISIFYACILNYFCLANEYATLEVIANDLLALLPSPLKSSIYQTYINTNYIHGMESEVRGCFVPSSDSGNSFNETYQNPYTDFSRAPKNQTDEEKKNPEESNSKEEKETDIQFGMFDFSNKDDSDNKEDNK